MITYIQKDSLFVVLDLEFSYPLNGVVGYSEKDFEDGKYIKLSDEQLEFKLNNPDATAYQTLTMTIGESELQKAKGEKLQQLDYYCSPKKYFKIITTEGSFNYYNEDVDELLKIANAAVSTNQESVNHNGLSFQPNSFLNALYNLYQYKDSLNKQIDEYVIAINNAKTIDELDSIVFEIENPNEVVVELV